MKKLLLFLLLSCVVSLNLTAQSYNPFVSNSSIVPAPMLDVQQNGSALIAFTIGNTGATAMPVVGTQSLKVSITLLRGVPNSAATPPAGVTGSWAQYFSWYWDSFVNTLVGTQTQTIPASDSGTIVLDYLVTSNSTMTSPQNGFNLNLVPPPYAVGSNQQGDDNISGFTYTSSSPLAVNIVNFMGKHSPKGNQLSWTTSNEVDNDYFEVFYGTNPDNLEKLVDLPSKAINGNSNEEIRYEYLHENPQSGSNYYRLHTQSINSKESVYNTISIYIKDGATLSVYPNPAHNQLFIDYSDGDLDVVNFAITDLQGKVIYKKKVITEYEAFGEVIPLKGLSVGTYLLSITDNVGYKYSQKITKR